jgi:hypothetical protein
MLREKEREGEGGGERGGRERKRERERERERLPAAQKQSPSLGQQMFQDHDHSSAICAANNEG